MQMSVRHLAELAGGDDEEPVRLEAAIALAKLKVLQDETVTPLVAAMTNLRLNHKRRLRVVQVVESLPPLAILVQALVQTMDKATTAARDAATPVDAMAAASMAEQSRSALNRLKVSNEEEAMDLISLFADTKCRPYVFPPLESFFNEQRKQEATKVDEDEPSSPLDTGSVWGGLGSLGVSSAGGGGFVSLVPIDKLRQLAGWEGRGRWTSPSLEAAFLLRRLYWADAVDV
mmetsp:Transcript_48636/g.105503  ORF Transcript_48636/g.105503 Transcript_48636/m.105503 type:complete len:231 (+) Transcript_48636:648-1340(+)